MEGFVAEVIIGRDLLYHCHWHHREIQILIQRGGKREYQMIHGGFLSPKHIRTVDFRSDVPGGSSFGNRGGSVIHLPVSGFTNHIHISL